jgi:hypothetical protein
MDSNDTSTDVTIAFELHDMLNTVSQPSNKTPSRVSSQSSSTAATEQTTPYRILGQSANFKQSPVYRFYKVNGNVKSCIQVGCSFKTEDTVASNLGHHLQRWHVPAYTAFMDLVNKRKSPAARASTSVAKRQGDVEVLHDAAPNKIQRTIADCATTKYHRDDLKQVRIEYLCKTT